MSELIHVEGWSDFQHYKDRRPLWIKVYTDLHHKDAYMGLTLAQRGILLGIWLEYAASGGQIELSTRKLSQRLGQKVTEKHLEALNHAGFIRFSASPEKNREEKKDLERVAEQEIDDLTMQRLQRVPEVNGAWKLSQETA